MWDRRSHSGAFQGSKLFVVVVSVGGGGETLSVPEASTEPLWSNETSVCLRSLYSLCRSQRGVDVSVSGRLETVETKAGPDAWFFSSSVESNRR